MNDQTVTYYLLLLSILDLLTYWNVLRKASLGILPDTLSTQNN